MAVLAIHAPGAGRIHFNSHDIHFANHPTTQEARPMILRWITHRFIARFERRHDYDMAYVRDIYDASARGFMHYVLTGGAAAWRGPIPRDAWFAAKIVAARAEDCGPCVQLVLNMAEAEGVPAAVRHAVWHRQPEAMSEDVRLAWRHAEAAVSHAPDIGQWCEAVERRWGRKGLTALAMSLTASRTFPMLKYALGHGQACRAVRIEGQTLTNHTPDHAASPASPPLLTPHG
jgi:alkylhydroperoxidase family enzyme